MNDITIYQNGNLSLSQSERTLLSDCEATIDRWKSAFIDAGLALATIRDERLYRETDATFEDYVSRKHGFGRNYGDKIIRGALVARQIGTIVPNLPPPENEAQVRELVALAQNRFALAVVWSTVNKVSIETGRDITSSVVKSVVDVVSSMAVTGAVDNGNGEDVPVSELAVAAITEDVYERFQRQRAALAEKRNPPIVNEILEVDSAGRVALPDLSAYAGCTVRILIYEVKE